MTTFLLVRHARTAAVGRAFSGRTPGVTLDAVGRAQAAALARRLAATPDVRRGQLAKRQLVL